MFAALGYYPRAITYESADGSPVRLTDGSMLDELFWVRKICGDLISPSALMMIT